MQSDIVGVLYGNDSKGRRIDFMSDSFTNQNLYLRYFLGIGFFLSLGLIGIVVLSLAGSTIARPSAEVGLPVSAHQRSEADHYSFNSIPQSSLDQRTAAQSWSAVPLVAPRLAISGTLLLTKTVATEPSTCSNDSVIYVPSNSVVYFCYQVENRTESVLNLHTLSDVSLPQQAVTFTYTLDPSQITTTILGPITITNNIVGADGNGLWDASGSDGNISATSNAEVYVSEPVLKASALFIAKTTEIQPNECGTGAVDQLAVPKGMPIQHCLVIENVGNRILQTITVDAPSLGIGALTLPNRQLAEGERYAITLAEINNLGVPAESISPGLEQIVTEPIETVFTASARTPELLNVSDTATSTVTLSNDIIEVELDVRAGTRKNQCDDTAVRVSQNTDVYFCYRLTNSGTIAASNLVASYTLPAVGSNSIGTLGINQTLEFTSTNAVRVITTVTDTVSLTGAFEIPGFGRVAINQRASRSVGLVPLANEVLTPLPTLSPTLVTAGPTATNTRRPSPNTPTPFPSFTPTITLTPSPRPAPPTNTVISPLPTPTATPTTVIFRAVNSPTPQPTVSPTTTTASTPTLTPTFTTSPTPSPMPSSTPVAAVPPTSTVAPVADGSASRQGGQPTTTALAQDRQLASAITKTEASLGPTLVPDEDSGTITNTSSITTSDGQIVINNNEDDAALEESDESGNGSPVSDGVSNRASETSSPVVPNSAAGIGASSQIIVVDPGSALGQGSEGAAASGLLFAATVIDNAIAAAAWIWFLCGSLVFFGVAGTIAGLYFRRQEKNRFGLIDETQTFDQAEPSGNVDTINPLEVSALQDARQNYGYGADAAQDRSTIPPSGSRTNTRQMSGTEAEADSEMINTANDQTRSSHRSDYDQFAPTSSTPIPQKPENLSPQSDDDEHWPASLP